ncbi:MAG: N-acetylmuramoyl-L-alanine amidase [Rubrivivax sp.]|nr:N-acetylmuramoyl-L-alanine amidase [Rubrivivax sp.]
MTRRRPSRFAPLLAALVCALMAGCATAPPGPPTTTEGGVPIDATRTAKGQDSRVLFLVIHYTVANFPNSMKILTEQEVSAHYLLSDEPQPRIFRLVDENRRAWHSGGSAWGPNKRLNSSSIGIEIVHPGFMQGPNGQRLYLPFPKAQIDALVPLVQDIVKRHQIRPERILGHGEVTPSYKEDPGPTFPWQRLAELGITPPWPDATRVATQRAVFELQPPDVAWFQQALAKHGYAVEPSGLLDRQTARVLMNFQMRYRPADPSGQPDAETAALLWVLTQPPAADGVLPLPTTPPLAPPDRPDPPPPPPPMR